MTKLTKVWGAPVTEIDLILSPRASLSATSMPDVTCPMIVYLPSQFATARSATNIWLSPSAGEPELAMASEPRRCLRVFDTSLTPIMLPLPLFGPRPHQSTSIMLRVCGSPNWTAWPGTTRCTAWLS